MSIQQKYDQALDYLYSYVDYSLKHSDELAKADFNLDRMIELMSLLGDPHKDYPIIHVAGTKGKGSTAAFTASALKFAGYSTGLYTSPHLEDYCERIQVSGLPISQEELVALVEEIKPSVEKVPFITTFELTTALGLLHFSKKKVDIAVLEVGLGGRLDATNIVTPIVSVITSLSMDHTAVLGNTLALIAGEKAGIIKPGVPVVSSPQASEALEVLKKVAIERNSNFTLVGQDLIFKKEKASLDGQEFNIWKPGKEAAKFKIRLLGDHQIQNAVTAFAALQVARIEGLKISDEEIFAGFENAFWPGRFEILRRDPPVILDSAHNKDSFIKLSNSLQEYFPDKKVILIFGASEDKDVVSMLSELKPWLSKIIFTQSIHPRAIDPDDLIRSSNHLDIPYVITRSVDDALDKALAFSAHSGEIVLSAGSMFVSAGVRMAWKNLYPIS